MIFHVFKSDHNRQWYFHLVARNGKLVLQSEGYHRKAGVLNAIAAIRKASFAPIFIK